MTLEEIVRIAFKRGENWGVCHSGWFTPSKEDEEKKVREALNEVR